MSLSPPLRPFSCVTPNACHPLFASFPVHFRSFRSRVYSDFVSLCLKLFPCRVYSDFVNLFLKLSTFLDRAYPHLLSLRLLLYDAWGFGAPSIVKPLSPIALRMWTAKKNSTCTAPVPAKQDLHVVPTYVRGH